MVNCISYDHVLVLHCLDGLWVDYAVIRGSWMGLSAWTIVTLCPRAQPEGIKNVHALNHIHEPRSYISLWWTILHTPLFCRFIPLIFQKYTINHHLYCHFPHLKVPVKAATYLECTIQNRGVRCACTYAWAHNNKYLWCTSKFSS